MRKSIKYSQNFIRSKDLVDKLIDQTTISKEDVVLEIGAGKGVITVGLADKAKNVIALEVDATLLTELKHQLEDKRNVKVLNVAFENFSFPSYPYKVFSNIPFNITSTVIKRLTESEQLQEAYLIVQKEAAKKFIGKPYDTANSQMAVLIKPFFNLGIVYEFSKDDFTPRPNVDIALLKINKNSNPEVEMQNKSIYQDFVVYAFNQFKPNIVDGLSSVMGRSNLLRLSSELKFSPISKPSQLDSEQWIGLFNYLIKNNRNKLGVVKGSFSKLKQQQSKLEKINRTRVDKGWKKFRKN